MIQFATYVGLDKSTVKLRQTAPMHFRTKVMRCVESVIEEKPIDPRTGDISGMVINRGSVAILVLKQIDRYNGPLSKEPRNPKANQRSSPI